MSYNLLFELAEAVGTERMIHLCEHFLATVKGGNHIPMELPILPPIWRDRGSRWEEVQVIPQTPLQSPPQTPRQSSETERVCPGAPGRRALFNSPLLSSAEPPPIFQDLNSLPNEMNSQ